MPVNKMLSLAGKGSGKNIISNYKKNTTQITVII